MIKLTIDGQEISVPKGTTVYAAAKELNINIPIFCYLDRMPPFGACRMCLVQVEKMEKLQTSCTLLATDGMVVTTQSQMAVDGRKEILEFLLINHPLDCPICDKGGECPLQDQTLAHGPGLSRFFEEKRRFKKPIPLGSVLMLDRERCILCARCTRFGDVVAGDHALEFVDRGYKTEVGTPDGGPAESKFIGNTIMICPVGALTSQVYRFRARPWDNDSTESSCSLCPVGCSLILDSRDGEIMRTRSSENKDVNDIWLCDKGWFGYEFAYHPERLQKPLLRSGDKFEPISWEEAFSLVAAKMAEARPQGKLAAFGGNPLTTEENYLFQKLMREGGGINNIDHRVGIPLDGLLEEGLLPGMEISIGDCENLAFIILFGIDLTEEFPVIWLRIKQAINKGAKVLFFGHYAPETARYFTEHVLHAPGEELNILSDHASQILEFGKQEGEGAVFIGRQYLASLERRMIVSEIAMLAKQMPKTSLNLLEGRGNSLGARLAGMRPDIGPLGAHISEKGLDSSQVIEESARGGWDFLYVAGSDPARKFSSKLWSQAREKLKFLVVQDLFLTETAKQADLVLPTLSFIEKEGSFINIERRVQPLHVGKEIPSDIYSDGQIFQHIAEKLAISLSIDSQFLEKLKPASKISNSDFGALSHRSSKAFSRFFVAKENRFHDKEEIEKLEPAQLYSGGLKSTFAYSLFDHGVRMKHNAHLLQMVKEPKVRFHPVEAEKRKIKEGDKVFLRHENCSIIAKATLDDQVAKGTLVIPIGFERLLAHELSPNLINGLIIEITS